MARLNDILLTAIRHSEYYKSRVVPCNSPSINDFPVLNKEELKIYCDELITDQYRYGDFSVLKSVFTSGSTGVNTKVFWTEADYIKSNISIWRLRKKWYGVSPAAKRVIFSSMIYNGRDLIKPPRVSKSNDGRTLSFSKFHFSDDDIIEYMKIIEEFEPFWMRVQTSTLIRIIDVMKRYKIPLAKSIQYVELNGEMVTKSNIEYFREYIDVPIANLYGAKEVNSIAYECPYHSLHVIEDNVYVESVSMGDDNNVTVVTSLHNTAMPIIRYNLGDEIVFSTKKRCRCGCLTQTIESIKGRSSDKISLKDGGYISANILVFYIESVNLMLHNAIVQFKICQCSYEHIEVLLKICVSLCDKKSLELITNDIVEKLGTKQKEYRVV